MACRLAALAGVVWPFIGGPQALLPVASASSAAAVSHHVPCLDELLDIAVTPQLDPVLWNATFRVSNPEWDGQRAVVPSFVALPRSEADVRRCLQCASRHGIRVAIKGGGHSFGGYSTLPAEEGFVINFRMMAEVSPVVERAGTGVAIVTVLAGARWRDVYQSFQKSGQEWVVNGGLCPSVGVAGFTMGGGVGPAARLHGMAVDSVQSFTVVRATGDNEVVTASEDSNPDLFWALRGGGGGNFGVVTQLSFAVHRGPDLYSFGEVCFPSGAAADLMRAMDLHGPTLPREVNMDAVFDAGPATSGASACLWVTSMLPLPETRAALAPVLAEVAPRAPTKDTLRERDCWWEGIADFAREHGYEELDDAPYFSKNCLVDSVPPALAAVLVNLTAAAPDNCGGQHFIAFGGKVAEVPAEATAFPWRSSAYMVYTSCGYQQGDAASRAAAAAFLDRWAAAVFPFCNGGSYVNFIDPLARGAGAERYYGRNLARLREVKQRWNPAGAGPLHFPMEVPGLAEGPFVAV